MRHTKRTIEINWLNITIIQFGCMLKHQSQNLIDILPQFALVSPKHFFYFRYSRQEALDFNVRVLFS